MNHIYRTMSIFMFFSAVVAQAQLAVMVSPPQIFGQKAVVKLAITNNLATSVESARAVCFLLDDHGEMVGQSTRWVIGGMKDRPPLAPKHGATFNFVVNSPQPRAATNLTAKVSFSRVVLAGKKLADVQRDVIVSAAAR